MLYIFAFDRKLIRWRVRLQIGGRRLLVERHLLPVFLEKFGGDERFIWSSCTQKTEDRAFKELSDDTHIYEIRKLFKEL